MMIRMTTTILRMLLILASMGMYRLIRYRSTPATINTIKIVKTGIAVILKFEKLNLKRKSVRET